MKRKETPPQTCSVCGLSYPRGRRPGGKLEPPSRYAHRRTCGRSHCVVVAGERTKARAAHAVRRVVSVAGLRAIALAAGREDLHFANCARCGDPFSFRRIGAAGRGRTKCDYCRTMGGGKSVTVRYTRGHNRGFEQRQLDELHPARIAQELTPGYLDEARRFPLDILTPGMEGDA